MGGGRIDLKRYIISSIEFWWNKRYSRESQKTIYEFVCDDPNIEANIVSFDDDGDWGYEAFIWTGSEEIRKTFHNCGLEASYDDPLQAAMEYVENYVENY